MPLLDRVSSAVASRDAARPFHDAVMTALGAAKVHGRPDALDSGVRGSAA